MISTKNLVKVRAENLKSSKHQNPHLVPRQEQDFQSTEKVVYALWTSLYRHQKQNPRKVYLQPLKPKAKKSLSPPKRRSRRSSVYHKGAPSKLSAVSISLEPIVTVTKPTQLMDSPSVQAPRKKVTAKRTAAKSPASPTVKKSQASAKDSNSKVTSSAFTAIKNAEDTYTKSHTMSDKKQKKRKLDVSVDNTPSFPLSLTPEAKRAKKSSPAKKSPPKSTRRRNRRISQTPVKATKTPARSAKTPRNNKSSTSPEKIMPPAQNNNFIDVSSQLKKHESPKKKPPTKATKTPKNVSKSPARKSTKTPAKVSKSPKIAKSPGKSKTPKIAKSPGKPKSPKIAKSPGKSKTPASVTKRKRETVIEKDVSITPPVKRSRKQTDSGKKKTPVVLLTKTLTSSVKQIQSPEKTSTPKSLKKLKSPSSSKRKIMHRRVASLKESTVKSPHVKMVTPVATPNLSAKKRIAQRKSTPARPSQNSKGDRYDTNSGDTKVRRKDIYYETEVDIR
ncbi:hypothetical protein KUTeg_005589 [Tegillarca granosa]|uniref:Uncharacterized protein n=1 Tax=Tegillarca granosa TaxID=220873 RepID=A0ABQ9FPN8_TEGGR|nr:hypothetical protein KUTeg_005589 [Tegillarca granosa]